MVKENMHHARYNPQNERIKYKYRQHMRRIGLRDEKTVLATLKHIRGFEVFIDFKGFETFNEHIADQYIQHMFKQNLSLSYITGNIRAVKDFLNWLERQKGYRSKIDYNHIEYLNISRNQRKTAKATEYQKSYSFDQIIKAIRAMPDNDDLEKRNKAIVSLQALCALRISELRTVKIKSLIEENGRHFIHVNPKHMSVKFAKTRQAYFMALPDDIIQNVLSWRDHLYALGFEESAPLFPRIHKHFGTQNMLEAATTSAEGIKSDTTIRDIFKRAFAAVGLPYIKPHSFRKTHALYAQNQSPAYLNAIRQNLGHSSIDTTMNSYGQLSTHEQGATIGQRSVDF